jgi:hypothetical protein
MHPNRDRLFVQIICVKYNIVAVSVLSFASDCSESSCSIKIKTSSRETFFFTF